MEISPAMGALNKLTCLCPDLENVLCLYPKRLDQSNVFMLETNQLIAGRERFVIRGTKYFEMEMLDRNKLARWKTFQDGGLLEQSIKRLFPETI